MKMTRTTKPLHKAASSIQKAVPATPAVVSPMPRTANGDKRKLTLQADKQKRKRTKATASCIEGSITQVSSASTPIVSAPNPALKPSLPPPNQASISMSPAHSVISNIAIRSATNLSHLRSPHPSPAASKLIPSSLPRIPSSLSVSSKQRYGSRSVLAPGDLRVTAVLETMRRLMEKQLLSQTPFPTEAEFVLVAYIIPTVADTD